MNTKGNFVVESLPTKWVRILCLISYKKGIECHLIEYTKACSTNKIHQPKQNKWCEFVLIKCREELMYIESVILTSIVIWQWSLLSNPLHSSNSAFACFTSFTIWLLILKFSSVQTQGRKIGFIFYIRMISNWRSSFCCTNPSSSPNPILQNDSTMCSSLMMYEWTYFLLYQEIPFPSLMVFSLIPGI